MSVAIIVTTVNDSVAWFNWQKRPISNVLYDPSNFVRNFSTPNDTFDLDGGTYRFDWDMTINSRLFTQGNYYFIQEYQTCAMNESSGTQIQSGCPMYTLLNTSALPRSPLTQINGYFIGAASAVNTTTNAITRNNHQLAINDTIYFTAPVPSPIVEGNKYFVISSGLTANVFKVSSTLGGSEVNLTTASLPLIFKQTDSRETGAGSRQFSTATGGSSVVSVANGTRRTFSIMELGGFGDKHGYPHGVTAVLGGAVVPQKYFQLRITKTA